MDSTGESSINEQRDRFMERLLQFAAGAFNIFAIYLGDRLGLYRALAEAGPATSTELAARTGTHERYVREWLEQQTVAGILAVEDDQHDAGARRFHLPPGHVEPLIDCQSLNYLAPLAQLMAGAVHPLPALVEAYRTGSGVPFNAYGRDLREGQAAINYPAFASQLVQAWLPAMPDVHARLQGQPPARIADVGCGYGWSSIAMGKGYPNVRVDGFDLDAPSIEGARENARRNGVDDRVAFHVRHLAGERGTVLVVDERVGEVFTAQGNDVEWMMYGWSILHCLPVGIDGQSPAGTGTVMRPATLRRYAQEAGFSDLEVLPIDNFFFRFYRLR